MNKELYPILEYDDAKEAIINPELLQNEYGMLPYNKLIITFFKDAINKLLEENLIEPYLTINGENELLLYKFVDDEVLVMQGIIGCPATAGFLDELTGIGITKVMFCGGGGVLDETIEVGKLMIVEGAIRDEGFSYHYVKPSRIIYSQVDVQDVMINYFEENEIPYFKGLTWTTDAFFRETKKKIQMRKNEGAKIVEMEQSGCIAVAQFRNLKYGAIIYAGDDISQAEWDKRDWHNKKGIRYFLVNICKSLVKII